MPTISFAFVYVLFPPSTMWIWSLMASSVLCPQPGTQWLPTVFRHLLVQHLHQVLVPLCQNSCQMQNAKHFALLMVVSTAENPLHPWVGSLMVCAIALVTSLKVSLHVWSQCQSLPSPLLLLSPPLAWRNTLMSMMSPTSMMLLQPSSPHVSLGMEQIRRKIGIMMIECCWVSISLYFFPLFWPSMDSLLYFYITLFFNLWPLIAGVLASRHCGSF